MEIGAALESQFHGMLQHYWIIVQAKYEVQTSSYLGEDTK